LATGVLTNRSIFFSRTTTWWDILGFQVDRI